MLRRALLRLLRSIRYRLAYCLRHVLYLERGSLVDSASATFVLRAVPAETFIDQVDPVNLSSQAAWPAVDVLLLEDVHLVGSRATPLDHRRRLVTEHTGGIIETLQSHAQSVEIFSLASMSLFVRPDRLDTAFSLCGLYVFNYYHWLIDCLPRLFAYEALLAQTLWRPAIVVPPALSSWQVRSLELMGYPPGSYLEHVTFHVFVKQYFLSTWHKSPSLKTAPSPTVLSWLREKLLSAAKGISTRSVTLLFVDRSGSRRPIANSVELNSLFTKKGFCPVRLEALSMDDQVALFSRAKVVSGLHGAGFANLVFSSSPWLFEIYSTSSPLPYYSELVEVLGGRYGCYVEGHNLNSGLPHISLKRVEAAIDSFLMEFHETH